MERPERTGWRVEEKVEEKEEEEVEEVEGHWFLLVGLTLSSVLSSGGAAGLSTCERGSPLVFGSRRSRGRKNMLRSCAACKFRLSCGDPAFSAVSGA